MTSNWFDQVEASERSRLQDHQREMREIQSFNRMVAIRAAIRADLPVPSRFRNFTQSPFFTVVVFVVVFVVLLICAATVVHYAAPPPVRGHAVVVQLRPFNIADFRTPGTPTCGVVPLAPCVTDLDLVTK